MKKYILFIVIIFFYLNNSFAQLYYTNPVLKPGVFGNAKINSMADPGVFRDVDGTYYMYVTGKGFPAFSSKDLVNWYFEKKVFTKADCKWAVTDFWAPEVFRYNNKYYLTYTAAIDKISPKRIGFAVSDSPLGPFVDVAGHPFYMQNETRGAIDSHFFIDDDNKVYMYYTCDLSYDYSPDATKKRSEIWVIQVKSDLSGFIGCPKMLTHPEQSWEFNPENGSYWNEGAYVFKKNKTYYLMFSANCFCSSNYGVGYATSTSPTGPFIKSPTNPILWHKNIPGVSGPGHNSIVESPDGSEIFCIYHSHVDVEKQGGIRMINIDRLGFDKKGHLFVDGPTVSPQLYPSSSNEK